MGWKNSLAAKAQAQPMCGGSSRSPTLVCYGQPGSSWAPQAIVALKGIGVAPHGVPCYVDEGDHVGLDQQPFWYAGALNVYHMGQNCTRMELHDAAAVEPAKQKVAAIVAAPAIKSHAAA